MDEILKDERFKHIAKDSRFRIMPRKERKFKVDKRFKNMFEDKKFKLKYTVDKRGRPINLTTSDNLKKFYELSSESDDEEDNDDDNDDDVKKAEKDNQVKKKEDESIKSIKKDENEVDSEQEGSEEEEEEGDESSEESESSEEESEDEDDESEKEPEVEPIPWNELDRDTAREDKISRRLALCNMDWDRIKAIDLFVLLNSFKTAQGFIKSVKIYLSEYGKKRLDYERLHGPQELTQNNENEQEYEFSDDDTDDEEGSKFDRRKLRIYQFNRLRYYYAIIECDTADTADKIYTECDGMEYESSSTRIDLRFVPDDTEFDEQEIRDQCNESPDPVTYKPNLFVTTALNQTKVECTWDETPRDRLAITMKKYTEEDLKNSDFKNILATSSDEEDKSDDENNDNSKNETNQEESANGNANEPKDEEEERIKKYRELLLGAETKTKKQRDCDLEFSWEGGMEEEGFNELLFNQKDSNSKKNNKKFDKKKELTEEEKKEQARLAMLTMDDEDNKAHFNLDDLLIDKNKKKGKKNRKGNDDEDSSKKLPDDFQLNINDPRFQAIFNDHKFNIDPSDQLFKKTKAMENILNEKIKRIETDGLTNKTENNEDIEKQNGNKIDGGVSLLVKSIKSKTESLKRKKEDLQKNSKINKKFKN